MFPKEGTYIKRKVNSSEMIFKINEYITGEFESSENDIRWCNAHIISIDGEKKGENLQILPIYSNLYIMRNKIKTDKYYTDGEIFAELL